MDPNSKYYGICFDRRSQNFGFHMIARSQLIADDRKRLQSIAEDRTWFYLLRSSAIVCDHDRRIADDRRSVFPYDRRRSQNILRSAICDPRSSAIIWKPAFMNREEVTTVLANSTDFFEQASRGNRPFPIPARNGTESRSGWTKIQQMYFLSPDGGYPKYMVQK